MVLNIILFSYIKYKIQTVDNLIAILYLTSQHF